MRLLERGAGVKAIGDMLGHRSLDSTCVYLRLDMKALRAVVLPVPGHTSPVRQICNGAILRPPNDSEANHPDRVHALVLRESQNARETPALTP